VIISENKDTAINFPPVPGGVTFEGDGTGGGTFATFGWITGAPHVLYWGDMDADGLEILDGFRRAGVPATSILMDPATYDAWERFGYRRRQERQAARSAPAAGRAAAHAERALYHQRILTGWPRHRRVEQERIPLQAALEQVLMAMADRALRRWAPPARSRS
jgi:hypothetical protein